jgi:ankyrin repeat protein
MRDLFESIESGDLPKVKVLVTGDKSLLQTIGEYGESPLMHAISVMDRDFAIIEFLVQSGADVNFATDEGYTALHCNIDLNGPSGSGEMPYRVARLLKSRGANLEARNHYGWTPLMRAGLEGTGDEFKALLEVGADFNVIYPDFSMPAFTRGKPLVNIVIPTPTKVKMLIRAGLKPTPAIIDEANRLVAGTKDKESNFYRGTKESIQLLKAELNAA